MIATGIIITSISGFTAAVISAIIGNMASKAIQKNNSRSLLSKYRSKWQQETRQYIAKYIYNAGLIVLRTLDNPAYQKTEDFNKIYSKLAVNQLLFQSMIDPTKAYYEAFDREFQRINDIFMAGKQSTPEEVSRILEGIHIAASLILEKSWRDIKIDCGVKISKSQRLADKINEISKEFNINI